MLLVLIPIIWLAFAAFAVMLCCMAARGEVKPAQATMSSEPIRIHRVGHGGRAAHRMVPARAAGCYRPRRPRTWGTVRSKILMSVQSDQFATYR